VTVQLSNIHNFSNVKLTIKASQNEHKDVHTHDACDRTLTSV